MFNVRLVSTFAAAAAALTACGSDSKMMMPPPVTEPMTITVSQNITTDTRWSKDKTYVLETHVFVERATLSIDEGTKIYGKSGSSLVVTADGKIEAIGTASAPIVFSSNAPEGTRAPGDWGGVVLLGRAPINVSGGTEKIEGFPATESLTTYGGTDAAHDCGTVRYVRIEYAGFELAPDNELNSLTLGGCGTATEIDYVQVHKGADDGVEIFGGTVNIRHVVISQPDDDGLDWDFGWSGKGQFIVVQQNAVAGNCAIEADNNKNNNDAEPRSNPRIWNASFIGSDAAPATSRYKQLGMHLRRGTAGELHNVILTRFADAAIDVDGASTKAQAEGGALLVGDSVFFDNAEHNDFVPEAMDNDEGFDEGAFFAGAALGNRFMDPALVDMLNLSTPNFKPSAGSPVMNMGATPPNDGFFDASATYVGAFGEADWTAGWTAFPAN